MMKRILLIVVFLGLLPIQNIYSWSLRTHIWIGQQVLFDLKDDGKITLLGKAYDVPNHIKEALNSRPQHFLAGCVGPDVFPDPIVGQTTTHPGVQGGWDTDQWLNHLLVNASSHEEIAFAFGFSCHIASDIFAHTYVNAFAGDIFVLSDDEREVEKRHFLLEKYIESLTPPIDNLTSKNYFNSEIKSPVSYISRTLILNKDVAEQYLKAGTGLHLYSMYQVRRGVKNLNNITSDLIKQITEWAADYYKLQAKLFVDLTKGKNALEAARITLETTEEALAVKEVAYTHAINGLKLAKQIVQQNPDKIIYQDKLVIDQAKIALDLANEAAQVAAKLPEFEIGISAQISALLDVIDKLDCARHLKSKNRKNCRRRKEENKSAINKLKEDLAVHKKMSKELKRRAHDAEKLKNEYKYKLDKLKKDLTKAKSDLTNKVFETKIEILEKEIAIEKELVKDAKKLVKESQEEVDKITGELDVIEKAIDKIKEGVDKYNPVILLIENWLGDIDNSVNEYIKASETVGNMMIDNNGDPIKEYWEWYKCYGGVFLANPQEIGELKCEVQNFYSSINEEYNKLFNELPDILQWIVNPGKKISEKALKELEPHLEEAKFNLVEFLTDKTTAEFVFLLADPKSANKESLINTFKTDNSNKKLLTFEDVCEYVDRDLEIEDGFFNEKQFKPIKHSVTLSKISILAPSTLNKLINDQLEGMVSSYFGKEVYKSDARNFSLLLGVVANIDGNHQWQTFGLPHPRNNGPLKEPLKKFGHNYYQNNNLGFKIFVDPLLRERVFIPLFEGGVMGSLRDRSELQWPRYLFPECNQNPFPLTQGNTGIKQESDNTCEILDESNKDFSLPFQSSKEFKDRFFQTDAAVQGSRTWTLIGSYNNYYTAKRAYDEITNIFPDIYCEIWKPNPESKNTYWTIMISAGTSIERASEVMNLAKRRRISVDSYTWTPTYPWIKLDEFDKENPLSSDSHSEFKERFFQMDAAVNGDRMWTLLGSYLTYYTAKRAYDEITNTFPDIYCEIWKPNSNSKNKYWAIMIAAGTNEERALEAMDLARKQGISKDSYIWTPTYPWIKYIKN